MSFYVGKRPNLPDPRWLKVTPELPYPLPLSLEELCLLEVINDVDRYPVELLASLPRWLRCRLLNNLPAVDLCRLDSTAVARGIDTNKVWKTRYVEEPKRIHSRSVHVYDSSDSRRQFFKKLFQINVQGSQDTTGYCRSLKEEVTVAFEDLKKPEHRKIKIVNTGSSAREMYLLEIASNALSYSSKSELKTIAHKLVSIRGDLLLHDLDANPRQLTDGQTIWSVQGNSLAISTCKHKPGSTVGVPADMKNEQMQLTPHRFIPICDATNSLELLSLLMNVSTLKPSSINLDIGPGGIPPEVRDNLLLRGIVIDNGSNPPSDSIDVMSILKFLLENVVILRLQSQSFTYIGLLVCMLEAATVRGNESPLKSLFCCLPDIYGETIQPFISLFSLQNFQLLHLDLNEVANPQMLIKLLQEFMIAPCSHSQQLVIDITSTGGFALPFFLNERRLASLDMGGAMVPKCALQHKTLRMTSPHLMEHMLQFILLLPSIRLTELVLDSHNSYIHLCACHPDLQVTKLRLVLNFAAHAKDSHILLATIKNDLISLLNKPNLQEISIAGKWEGFGEAKLGLLLGLDDHPSLLKKIILDVKGYSEEELKALWTTLFMFKQLHKLDIVLGGNFRADLFKSRRSAIYESWKQLATCQ